MSCSSRLRCCAAYSCCPGTRRIASRRRSDPPQNERSFALQYCRAQGGNVKKVRFSILRAVAVLALITTALAVRVGEPAPGFTAKDSNGKSQSLSNYRGKYVVLEWHNQGCPYTKKHYSSGNMQRLQKEWTGKGVVWFTVISSAPGTQGFVTPTQENDYLKTMK